MFYFIFLVIHFIVFYEIICLWQVAYETTPSPRLVREALVRTISRFLEGSLWFWNSLGRPIHLRSLRVLFLVIPVWHKVRSWAQTRGSGLRSDWHRGAQPDLPLLHSLHMRWDHQAVLKQVDGRVQAVLPSPSLLRVLASLLSARQVKLMPHRDKKGFPNLHPSSRQ